MEEERKERKEKYAVIITTIVGICMVIYLLITGIVYCTNNIKSKLKIHTDKINVCGYEYHSAAEGDYIITYKINKEGGKEPYKMPAKKTVIFDTLEPNAQSYAEIERDGYYNIKEIRYYVPIGTLD